MNSQVTQVQAPIKRAEIQEEARKLIGVKWRHQGRTPEVGVDCAGAVVVVARNLNISSYDSTDYHRNPLNDSFVQHFQANMKRKKITDRRVGDVLLFRDKMFSCHSGFLTMKNGVEHIVHAYALRKKVIEEPLNDDWRSRITYCFEFYGVED